MSWGEALPIVFATIACFFFPGIVIALIAGLRGLGVAALAPALSLGLAGVGAVVLNVLGIAWNLWSYLGFTASVAVSVFVLVRVPVPVGRRKSRASTGSTAVRQETDQRFWPALAARVLAPLGGVITAGLVSLGPLQEGMRRPDFPALTWDSIHHHSSVRYIIETGNGSSMDLGGVASNNNASRFYPGAWHDLVSLTVGQLPLTVSINVAALVMACLIWPLSVAYLARVTFPRLVWMPLLAPVLAAGFIAFPARMMSYGTVWPAAMGTAILPVLIALILVITGRGPTPARRFRLSLLLLIGLAGATLCHPTAMVAAAYLAMPFLLYRYAGVVSAAVRRRKRVRAVALVALPAVVVGLVVTAVTIVPGIRSVFFFQTTPVGPATDAVGAAVFDTMLAPLGHGNTEPFWIAGLLAIAGSILTLTLREYRWVSVSWMISILLYVVAAGEQTVLRPLVGLWYSDPVRLGGLVPLFTTLLAAYAVLRVIDAIVTAIAWWRPVVGRCWIRAIASLVLLAAVSALLYPQTDDLRADERSARLAADYWRHLEWDGGIVSLPELEFIERLGDELPDDAVVLGDPTSGAALVYSLAEKETMFRTMAGSWDADAEYLGRNFNRLDSDPRVCQLIEQYGVTHFYDDDGRYLRDIVHRRNMNGLTAAGIAPGELRVIDASGDGAFLYEIDACGE